MTWSDLDEWKSFLDSSDQGTQTFQGGIMKKWYLAALLFCLIPLNLIAAEANQASQAGRFFVNPMVGIIDMESSSYDPEANFSLGGGYNYNANLSSEILATYAQDKSGPDSDVYSVSIGGIYHLIPEESLVPYLVAGLGLLTVDEDGEDNDHHGQLNYGAGLKYFLNEDFALNTEVRHMLATSGEPNNLLASAGLVYYFGGEKPAPAPLDSDGDGVFDAEDQCPGTPAGVTVDGKGCPLDTDGDGVYDYLDKCPGTPAGVAVDSKGCPLDTDGDGVYDYLDKCPGTPAGVKVDAVGCPLPIDSDGDGVYDDVDRCPNSPAGAHVDEYGCQLVLTLLIEFDTNKALIRPQHIQDMTNAAAFINKYPGEKILIAGHTDSDGSEAYNLQLSQKRADAVKAYLIQNYAIDGANLTAKGFGESQPIADNTTAAGKQKNRRVELSLFNN
ncbi:MAG: outer membrane beta-barrel domain-containing protein [Desulfuromonas sp.]|nr:MAG: outer membrane beta-barrel domain-containing protein [Desulfuromonas sp.]